MRLIVCGARAWWDRQAVHDALTAMNEAHYKIELIVHGGCRGPDTWAGEWAEEMGVNTVIFPADWEGEGKSAGFKRNQRMVDQAPAYMVDGVLAFVAGEAKGTGHTIRLALKAGLSVWVVMEGVRSIHQIHEWKTE